LRQIYIGISKIDCDVLIGKLKEKPLISIRRFLLPAIQSLCRYLMPGSLWRMSNLALSYGITADIGFDWGDADLEKHFGGDCMYMYKITAQIDSVDTRKAVDSARKLSAKLDGKLVAEVIRIIEPFFAKTFDTIPPSAVAELFTLIGREKAIEIAEGFGVKLSDLTISSDSV
jgi:hypothetical protein